MIKIKLEIKDYGEHELNAGITPLELIKQLGLKEKPFLGKLNGVRINLNTPIEKGGFFEFIFDSLCSFVWEEANTILTQVLYEFLEEQQIATELVSKEISELGFAIEFKTMNNISEKQLSLFGGKVLKRLSKQGQMNISPLEPSLIKFLKLRGVSGVESSDGIVNRIFGFATLTKEAYEQKLQEIEELESRDHRKIGKELEIFMIDEAVGKGLPIWLPNGVTLKRQISNFIYEQEEKYGSLHIESPILGLIDLYKTSGHYHHYKDIMFPEIKIDDNETFMLRPMACPHHIIVYKSKAKSFRELPIRYTELVKQYRFETSGSLLGLERVRAMELTDSHIFLRKDQVKDELRKSFKLIEETLKKFNIEIDHYELALRDPSNTEKYHGDDAIWNEAEKELKEFLDEEKVNYVEKEGEAAFYGPKIDVQIKTSLGHIIAVSTIQLDFFLPEKFNLYYIDSNKNKIMPSMIHRGHIGTLERFISILLEQTKGNLPMWLAPQQAVILPISNEAHIEYAKKLYNQLKEVGIRVKLDDSDERLSYKIREYQTKKVKTQLVIGDDEIKNKTVSLRYYGKEDTQSILLEDIEEIYRNLSK